MAGGASAKGYEGSGVEGNKTYALGSLQTYESQIQPNASRGGQHDGVWNHLDEPGTHTRHCQDNKYTALHKDCCQRSLVAHLPFHTGFSSGSMHTLYAKFAVLQDVNLEAASIAGNRKQ